MTTSNDDLPVWARLCVRDGYEPEAIRIFLLNLRDSGITNMYGAGAYLTANFDDMANDTVEAVMDAWMHSLCSYDYKREAQG